MDSPESVATGFATGFATGAGNALGKEVGKSALNIVRGRIPSKEPIIFFALYCSLRDPPSYDIVNSEINKILSSLNAKTYIVTDKITFNYDIQWDFIDECADIEDSWESDIIHEENPSEEDISHELVSRCVSGFTLSLATSSQGETKEVATSAYEILDEIKRRLENNRLSIRRNVIFAFLRADPKTCAEVQSRLSKTMIKEKLPGIIDCQSLTPESALLSVPLHERLTAIAFSNSFKRWAFP